MIEFLSEQSGELWKQTVRHLLLTGASSIMAIIVGVPLGILIFRVRSLRQIVLGGAGVFQNIPSVAMLGLLLILFVEIGIRPALGLPPAITALVLYALLPIIRNTFTGLEGVPAEIAEAARGLGFTDRQRLLRVELPLALPVIIAGIRTAVVIGVGIATLSALVGAGGLGDFIFQGIAMLHVPRIALGCAASAAMALLFDFLIGLLQKRLQRAPRTTG